MYSIEPETQSSNFCLAQNFCLDSLLNARFRDKLNVFNASSLLEESLPAGPGPAATRLHEPVLGDRPRP